MEEPQARAIKSLAEVQSSESNMGKLEWSNEVGGVEIDKLKTFPRVSGNIELFYFIRITHLLATGYIIFFFLMC